MYFSVFKKKSLNETLLAEQRWISCMTSIQWETFNEERVEA